jgi:hypothetical protein
VCRRPRRNTYVPSGPRLKAKASQSGDGRCVTPAAKKLTAINVAVFDKLMRAFLDDSTPVYAADILDSALGWGRYEMYLAEMRQMLGA